MNPATAEKNKLRTRPLPIKFPRNCVVFLGGTNSPSERNYLLWKDGKTLCVQAPLVWTEEEGRKCLVVSDERHRQTDDEWFAGLRTIHSLLNTVEFGKGNWGYLVSGKDGVQHIVQRQKRLRKVVFNTWAPVINEREIEYTRFNSDGSERGGYWRGRPVDVFIGYDDFTLRVAEILMRGYWLTRGLDITYELVAHIVDDDGNLIGMASEADLGRLPQYRDKALLYEAFARLQQHGIVYLSGLWFFVTIFRGKVRLTNVAAFRARGDPNLRFEEEVMNCHWKALEWMFSGLDPNNFTPRPVDSQAVYSPLLYMSVCPSPERPLFVSFGHVKDISIWTPPQELADERRSKNRRRRLLITGPGGRTMSEKTNNSREIVGASQLDYRPYPLKRHPREITTSKVIPLTFTDIDGDVFEDISSPQIELEQYKQRIDDDDPRRRLWNKPFLDTKNPLPY